MPNRSWQSNNNTGLQIADLLVQPVATRVLQPVAEEFNHHHGGFAGLHWLMQETNLFANFNTQPAESRNALETSNYQHQPRSHDLNRELEPNDVRPSSAMSVNSCRSVVPYNAARFSTASSPMTVCSPYPLPISMTIQQYKSGIVLNGMRLVPSALSRSQEHGVGNQMAKNSDFTMTSTHTPAFTNPYAANATLLPNSMESADFNLSDYTEEKFAATDTSMDQNEIVTDFLLYNFQPIVYHSISSDMLPTVPILSTLSKEEISEQAPPSQATFVVSNGWGGVVYDVIKDYKVRRWFESFDECHSCFLEMHDHESAAEAIHGLSRSPYYSRYVKCAWPAKQHLVLDETSGWYRDSESSPQSDVLRLVETSAQSDWSIIAWSTVGQVIVDERLGVDPSSKDGLWPEMSEIWARSRQMDLSSVI